MYDYEKNVLKSVADVKIEIDFDSIPEYQRRQLAELALGVTREVFSRPGEEERYQAWIQNRQQREKEATGE